MPRFTLQRPWCFFLCVCVCVLRLVPPVDASEIWGENPPGSYIKPVVNNGNKRINCRYLNWLARFWPSTVPTALVLVWPRVISGSFFPCVGWSALLQKWWGGIQTPGIEEIYEVVVFWWRDEKRKRSNAYEFCFFGRFGRIMNLATPKSLDPYLEEDWWS